MPLSRRKRFVTVFLALFSLLFMQLAVANYVCPSIVSGGGGAAMAHVGMPCAQAMPMTMDEAQPGLCHAHCHADKQSLDKHELPSPVGIDTLPADFTLPDIVPVFSGAPLQVPHLTRTTAPPLAIQNCCFRN